jgi:NADPH:quinone reductase-like Zn-dependent oxidoreductase
MVMRAIEYSSYGSPDVLKLVELEKPVPANNEILIRIHATTVTATEITFRKGEPYFSRLFTGLTKPKLTTLGEELSGVVEALGKKVKRY